MSVIKLKNKMNEELSFDFGGRRLTVAPHAVIELEQDVYRDLCHAHNVTMYLSEIVADVNVVEAVAEAVIECPVVEETKEAPKKKKASK